MTENLALGLIRQIEFNIASLQNGNVDVKQDYMEMIIISLTNIAEFSDEFMENNTWVEALIVHQNVYEKIGQYIQAKGELETQILQKIAYMAESIEHILNKNIKIGETSCNTNTLIEKGYFDTFFKSIAGYLQP